jgi:hypothetical protein
MIDKLLSAVADWPVIVQGALGSALFAGLAYLGQRLTPLISARFSEVSKKRRKAFLFQQRLKYAYKVTKDNPTRGAIISALLYIAARSLIRAAIWLVLGLIFSSFEGVLGVVGFGGCLYYLFAALSVVNHVPDAEDNAAKLEELRIEAEKLGDESAAA